MNITELAERIQAALSSDLGAVVKAGIDMPVATVQSDRVVALMMILKEDANLRFAQLTDITAVDYPGREQRFEVVYHLLSFKLNARLRIKTKLEEGKIIPTANDVHKSAGWFEREVFDMYGIRFYNHPDLRRILTDYGFKGHPLRKDFPVTGYVEVRYDPAQQKVIYEPVKLDQEFRNFDFLSPWEGTEYLAAAPPPPAPPNPPVAEKK
jgi:NADH-quinone oxidoreductase subunit C